MYFFTLFPKFGSLNGNTCAQLFTYTEFISLHTLESKAEAGNYLNELIDDIGITMNMRFDNAADLFHPKTSTFSTCALI